MKKQELTTDHTVIYRNGGSFKPTSITGLINLNGYLNDDLTDVENELNDIIEVQKDGQTIWKRDFEKKDTTPIELLRSLPESVQFVIVNAMSEEQKTSLIGL